MGRERADDAAHTVQMVQEGAAGITAANNGLTISVRARLKKVDDDLDVLQIWLLGSH